jgi:hypothetical protein
MENLFTEGDKGKQEWAVISTCGLSVLALDSFYGLTSNFSCPMACLKQSSLPVQWKDHHPELALAKLARDSI